MLKTHTHADTHTHNEISFSHKIKWKSCHVPCYKNSQKAAMSGCESKTPEGVCTEIDGPNVLSVPCREWYSAGSEAEHPCSILY